MMTHSLLRNSRANCYRWWLIFCCAIAELWCYRWWLILCCAIAELIAIDDDSFSVAQYRSNCYRWWLILCCAIPKLGGAIADGAITVLQRLLLYIPRIAFSHWWWTTRMRSASTRHLTTEARKAASTQTTWATITATEIVTSSTNAVTSVNRDCALLRHVFRGRTCFIRTNCCWSNIMIQDIGSVSRH